MKNATPTTDDLAQLCVTLARDEVYEIMGGPNHITMDDLTPVEMIAVLATVRPAYERQMAARRQPSLVLELVRPDRRDR